MIFVRLVWTLCRNWYLVAGRVARTPREPPVVQNSRVSMFEISVSGSFITKDPLRKRFTKSPTWNWPTTSSFRRSSSVAASLFFFTVKKLKAFSAPMNLKKQNKTKTTKVRQKKEKERNRKDLLHIVIEDFDRCHVIRVVVTGNLSNMEFGFTL